MEEVTCANCGHKEEDHDGYGGLCDGLLDVHTRSMCGCVEFTPREQRELLCMACRLEYPVWYADSPVWNAVVRQDDGSDRWPFLCPTCFAIFAELQGFEGRWHLRFDDRTPTLPCRETPYGEYRNQVSITPPPSLGLTRPSVSVDLCLAAEIVELWAAGITTIESCCGHGRQQGYIAVTAGNAERMEALGYTRHVAPGQSGPDELPDQFWVPRTGCTQGANKK